GLARVPQRGPHLVDSSNWNALVGAAIEAEYRRLELGHDIDRVLRMERIGLTDDAAVPGDACLHVRIVCGVEPDDSAAPAEAGDPQSAGVALAACLCPGNGRVQVGENLGVGDLGDHRLEDLLDVLELGDVALAGIELRRDCKVAELGEAAADILD